GATTASASAISGGNQFTVSGATIPPPVLGASADLAHVSGTVLVKLAGKKKYTKLTKVQRIPFGATINAIHGHVQATLRLPQGKTQTGVFSDGESKLKQRGNGAPTATLAGGSFQTCPKQPTAHGAAARTAAVQASAASAQQKAGTKPKPGE